jgi:AcrR family transcriptional regulator
VPAKQANRAAGSRSSETRERIVEAAEECFIQNGTQRTSMSDIAAAAGVSRKTLYRQFEDRPALIEALLIRRIYQVGDKLRKGFSSFSDFEEALVEGSILSVTAGRKDQLINEVVQKESNHRIEQFLFRGNQQIQDDMRETWFPVIELGRRKGSVRPDLTDERIIEIIINIHALLLMRDDYGPAKQREFLQDVLVPAITGSV